jgi:hypothetical protein
MSHICYKCGKECKDKKGLSLHQNKCGIDRSTQCSHCSIVLSTIDNLNRHYLTCKVLKDRKQQDEKEREKLVLSHEFEEIKKDYENKLNHINTEYQLSISTVKKLYDHIDRSQEKITELEQIISNQKEKILQLENKTDYLNEKMIHFAERATRIK